MAYQEVEAKFLVTFNDSEDAEKLVKAKIVKRPAMGCFEINMTDEQQRSIGEQVEPTVELLFSGRFDVEVTKGWAGSLEEPPEGREVEGYVRKKDVVDYLKNALRCLEIDVGEVDIECTEYESDSEQEIIDREGEYNDEYEEY